MSGGIISASLTFGSSVMLVLTSIIVCSLQLIQLSEEVLMYKSMHCSSASSGGDSIPNSTIMAITLIYTDVCLLKSGQTKRDGCFGGLARNHSS